jgi:hypothetical protein
VKRHLALWLLIALAIAPGCTVDNPSPAQVSGQPSPTVASIFEMPPTPSPGVIHATAQVSPSPAVPASTATPQPQVYEQPVYEDALSAGWSISNSQGMSVDLNNTTHTMSSTRAISFTPLIDYGWLYFTLEPNAPLSLPYDKVVAISMYINGGDYEIGPSDLAISIRGSNAYPYWVSDDNSVHIDDKEFFSETRLYDLEITRAIPRDTWVEVIVYPSKLIYDPVYKYVTGFYLKNDKGVHQTIYVDHIRFLLTK